ncbi:VOC family protein [Niallia sp. FSL W8-1348]|uniref:VOC family protein n=1 Tax=Niallia sp. FSL W8-1348 TaxID=2954656 RepID=UPI0030F9675F
MKIEHIAIWVHDLEEMKKFYTTYFDGIANSKYHNTEKKFESYFISYKGGARIELMRKSGIDKPDVNGRVGLAHIAFSVGSKEAVNQLTERLQKDGYLLVNGPRITGDGYYESVIEDPEGNLLELTV